MTLFSHPHAITLTLEDPDATIMKAMGEKDVIVVLRVFSAQNVRVDNTLDIIVRRQWDDDVAGPHEVPPDPTYGETLRAVPKVGLVWSFPVAAGEQLEFVGPDIDSAPKRIDIEYVLEVIT